jgi:hypothetical protein
LVWQLNKKSPILFPITDRSKLLLEIFYNLLIVKWHFFSDPGQHGLQLESMVASGGDLSPVDTELSTPPQPKVSTVEEEEDIDPTVAEMNRKNAQRTQQQTEKEVKSSENIQHVKSSENIHNVKPSDNIQHQSKDGVKRTADKVTDEQNIVMGSSPSQSGARGSQSHASSNSSKYCYKEEK